MTRVAYGKPETTQAEPLCEAPAASTRLAKLSSAQRSNSTKALDGAKLGLVTTGNWEMDAYLQVGAGRLSRGRRVLNVKKQPGRQGLFCATRQRYQPLLCVPVQAGEGAGDASSLYRFFT